MVIVTGTVMGSIIVSVLGVVLITVMGLVMVTVSYISVTVT